jgi:hypothetical protein
MEAFFSAGHYCRQFSRLCSVLHSVEDPVESIKCYNEYMRSIQNQFKALVLNGSLCSSHTLFALRNLESVAGRSCEVCFLFFVITVVC